MREKLSAVMLVLCSVLIGLLFAESIIRVMFPSYSRTVRLSQYMESERGKFTRYDKVLGWAGLENADADFLWIDCRHHVRQNNYGFRGMAYALHKKNGNRSVVLGDSFVWGFGVENDEVFTRVIERQNANTIEMVNMGVSGYGTDQEYLLWSQKGYLWGPDEVILMVNMSTDLEENMYDLTYSYPKPRFTLNADNKLVLTNVPVPGRKIAWNEPRQEKVEIAGNKLVHVMTAHSAFAALVLSAGLRFIPVRNYLESHEIVFAQQLDDGRESPLYLIDPDRKMQLRWRILFGIIHMLNTDVKKHNAKLTVVIIPSIEQVYPELWDEYHASLGAGVSDYFDPEAPNRRIAQWCKENEISVIDLLPGLKDAGRTNPSLYYPINRHWTAAGHRIAADILINQMNRVK